MATPIQPLVTVEDLEYMPEDGNQYEVVEGELFVSKSPSIAHQDVCAELTSKLRTYLSGNRIGHAWPGIGVVFSHISGVIPDIVYVSNERIKDIASGDRVVGAPDLVVEIVSPGIPNSQRDRVVKKQLYASYGVKEYWLVDLLSRTIEVYVLQGKTLELEATYSGQDELVSSVLPGFNCDVDRIFRP
ncbi:MAG TPA: Uma2 family endonuclease [Blastocatellia bacterium]|nr:Uma2 family endonuclease [Blastocatellia bacterium]